MSLTLFVRGYMLRFIYKVRYMIKTDMFKSVMKIHTSLLVISIFSAMIAQWLSQDVVLKMYSCIGVLAALYVLIMSVSAVMYAHVWLNDSNVKSKIMASMSVLLIAAAMTKVIQKLGTLVLSSTFDAELLMTNEAIDVAFDYAFAVVMAGWSGVAIAFVVQTGRAHWRP
jgi:hypothetical protein